MTESLLNDNAGTMAIEPSNRQSIIFDRNDIESQIGSKFQSNSGTQDTQVSIFDSNLHCRYCFIRMKPNENYSACKCTGMLCQDCLTKELKLTFQRSLNRNQNFANNNSFLNDANLKCTVCDYRYQMQRSKLDIEQSMWKFLKYIFKITFPKRNERDMSVFSHFNAFNQMEFDINTFVIPIQAAKVAVTTVAIWILFTLSAEVFGGPQIGDGRVIALMFDAYLIMEVLRVTKFIDFPERVWLLIWYFLRLVIVSIWAIQSYAIEKNSQGIVIPPFNWQWLTFYIFMTMIYFGFEIPSYITDVHRRALKQNSNKIQVNIVSANDPNKTFGPFILDA